MLLSVVNKGIPIYISLITLFDIAKCATGMTNADFELVRYNRYRARIFLVSCCNVGLGAFRREFLIVITRDHGWVILYKGFQKIDLDNTAQK